MLISIWMAGLLAILFTANFNGIGKWEGLFLGIITALVFRGYWNIVAPIQSKAINHINDTKLWLASGYIEFHTANAYFDWPGTSMVHAVLSETTGVDLFTSAAIIAVSYTHLTLPTILLV